MIIGQVIISVFMMILQFFMVIGSFQKDGLRIFVGILTGLIYFISIASRAYSLTKSDKKSYTPLNPSIKWAVLWGLALVVFNIILIAINKLCWVCFSDGTTLRGAFAIVTNILFYVLESPFLAFTITSLDGVMPAMLIVAMLLVPFLASVAGYYIAMHEFVVADKLNSIVFETEKNDK